MRSTLIVIIITVALLAACGKQNSSSSSSVSAQSTAESKDAVTQKLQDLAGSGAADCGRVKSQAPDLTQKASDCATKAAKDKHAFYVAYDMPGLTVGYAGNSQGKLYSVQSEQGESAGGKTEVASAPCPSELRIAQSGRVTCIAPGSGMGAIGGTGNPHGGTPAATGENPRGGMMTMPNIGTPNPHGTTQPAHPPAQKTPPKQ